MKFSDLYVGQKVVVAYTTGNGFYSSREGKTGTIVELDKGASLDVLMRFDEPGVDDDWGQSRELRAVNVVEGFKVGDKVRIAHHGYGFFSFNFDKVGTIVELDLHDETMPVRVKFDGEGFDWGRAGGLELIEEDTRTPAQKAGLVIGEKYRIVPSVIDGSEHYAIPAGDVVTFIEDDETSCPRFRTEGGARHFINLERIGEKFEATPAEKLGYKVGDKFVVEHFSTFDKGSIITLHRDDGSSCPLFVGEGTRFRCGPDETPGAYVSLDSVRKYEPTPAEEAGFKVGDQAVVIDDECGFKAGQLVTLFSDDGSTCPTWKGENTRYNNAGGEPGAYASVRNMRKVDVAEQAKRVQELEAEVKRLNTLLQAARDLLN